MNRLLGAASLARARRGTRHAPGSTGAAADQPALQAIDVQPLRRPAAAAHHAPVGPGAAAAVASPSTTRRASRWTCRTPRWRCPRGASTCTPAGVDTILAAEAKDRTRLVLNLDKLVPYDTRVDGQQHHRACSAAAASASATSAARHGGPAALPSSSGGTRELRSIDFRRGADGAGRVIVKLSDPHTHINLHQVGNQIVVDFADAGVPANLVRRYDATDFGTPVTGFDVTARRQRRAHRDHRQRRLRAARLPVRRPVRGRGRAAPQGRQRRRRTSRSTPASG